MRRLTNSNAADPVRATKLTEETTATDLNSVRDLPLTSEADVKGLFKISIDHKLENNYQFKNLSPSGIKQFSRFLVETVGKRCSISDVDTRFLRTRGKPIRKEKINGVQVDMIHYGVTQNSFRIFGYYNNDGYFVIHRIDPKHNYDKS